MADRDAQLLALMSRQHWVASRRQAARIGIDRKAVARRVRTGILCEPVAGILHIPGMEWTWETRCMAALLCGGRGAAVSHRAAMLLHGIGGFDRAPVEITVRRPHNRFGDEIVHVSRDLGPVDVMQCGPFPVTTVARTLLDVGPLVGRRVLIRALDDARRKSLVTTDDLAGRLRALRRHGRPGVALLDGILADEGDEPILESVLERMFLEVLERHGLPSPERQVVVVRPDGRRARLDMAYIDAGIAIELDGHGSHAARDERARDSARQNDIALDASMNWTILRFTYEQVRDEPEYVAQTVRRALRRNQPIEPARQTRHR